MQWPCTMQFGLFAHLVVHERTFPEFPSRATSSADRGFIQQNSARRTSGRSGEAPPEQQNPLSMADLGRKPQNAPFILQAMSSPLDELQSYPPAIAEGSQRGAPNLSEWAEVLHLAS